MIISPIAMLIPIELLLSITDIYSARERIYKTAITTVHRTPEPHSYSKCSKRSLRTHSPPLEQVVGKDLRRLLLGNRLSYRYPSVVGEVSEYYGENGVGVSHNEFNTRFKYSIKYDHVIYGSSNYKVFFLGRKI